MIDRQRFAGLVKQALASFYDPARLQTHPLAELVLPGAHPEQTRGQALRQVLVQALDGLRPGDSAPYGGRQWLPHRVLWLRYIECQSVSEVCSELAIGRTAYY